MSEQIRIPNIDTYNQEIINGELILTPNKEYITESELNIIDIKNSKIQDCFIKHNEETISTNTKYRRILIDIWSSMPTQKILQNSSFNLNLKDENGRNGYNWCDDIHMSFQDKCAAGTLHEIVHMVKVNKYTLKISIKLKTNKIIHFKI
tara:strand:+ start:3715 stop:4161 length:447 start_codon:yes stop_codon:yes gene_type:complete